MRPSKYGACSHGERTDCVPRCNAEEWAPVLIVVVIVVVVVIVIAPVIVAALVNGNDAVDVIDAVDDQGSTEQDRTSLTLHRAPE